jgi:hypothetical protein
MWKRTFVCGFFCAFRLFFLQLFHFLSYFFHILGSYPLFNAVQKDCSQRCTPKLSTDFCPFLGFFRLKTVVCLFIHNNQALLYPHFTKSICGQPLFFHILGG